MRVSSRPNATRRVGLGSSLVLAVAVAATAAWSGPVPHRTEVRGVIAYSKDGVESLGKKTAWKDLSSLEDLLPDREALAAEFAHRKESAGVDLASHLKLGAWARDHELEDAARAEFEAAIAIDPNDLVARRAAGWVRSGSVGAGVASEKDGGEWRRVEEVFEERLRSLAPGKSGRLQLARWCNENGYEAGEWRMLVDVSIADSFDKEMIARIGPLVDRRRTRTLLRPPLTGTVRALVDTTHHHELKAFALRAIDFQKVDEKGSAFSGNGAQLSDYYGFHSIVRAAADGRVSMVEDSFPDLPPGVGGKFDEANYIVVDHTENESSDYGHIEKGSALVKVGDLVKAGQPIARVGNSGASGRPHLHFTMSLPVTDEAQNGGWISVPWRMGGFRVVEANGAPCDFEVRAGTVQEGWKMFCPEPKG